MGVSTSKIYTLDMVSPDSKDLVSFEGSLQQVGDWYVEYEDLGYVATESTSRSRTDEAV